MLEKFILFLLVLNPRHELNKDSELLAEVAGYVEEAVETFDLPTHPSRLAHHIYRESSWIHTSVGKIPNRYGVILNEQGYCQAHGRAKKLCLDAGYDPETRRGGIMCLGYLFHYGMTEDEACAQSHPGNLEAAIRWYASGSCYKAKKKMAERKRDWERKWKRVLGENWEGRSDRLVAWRRKMERERKKVEEEFVVGWGG